MLYLSYDFRGKRLIHLNLLNIRRVIRRQSLNKINTQKRVIFHLKTPSLNKATPEKQDVPILKIVRIDFNFSISSSFSFRKFCQQLVSKSGHNTAPKMKFSIQDFFSKCDKTSSFCEFGHIY